MIKRIIHYLFFTVLLSVCLCNVVFACTATISGTTVICSAGSAALRANAGSSYLWSTGATTQTITPTIPGNYTVTVTDSLGCTASATVTVTTSALQAPNISTSINLSGFCTGTVTGNSNVAGAIYTWTGPGTAPTNVNPLTIIYPGTYVLTVLNPVNGCNSSGAVSGGFPGSTLITASNDVAICPGNSTVLTATGGNNYTWSPATGLSSTTGSPVTATPGVTTTYVVTNTTTFFGCVSTDTVTVTVTNPIPASITGNLTFCTGGNTTLTANTGSSYLWSTGATTQSINVNTAGSYTVTVSDNAGCVSVSNVVSVNTIPCTTGITGIKIAGDTCDASSAITFQVLGTSSSPYFAWNFGDPASGVNNTVTITGASANPNPSHTFTAPGTYTICATFQEPGFPVSQVCRTIRIGLCCNGIPTSSTTNINICPSQLPYNWNGSPYNAAGTYTTTLVNAAGCDSIATLILNVGSTSTSTTTVNICPAQLPYNWNGNVYNAAGTFNVTLTGTSGCDSIATLILNVGSVSTSTTTANICPAQLPYNWNGNVYNAAGTFNVTLIGSAGCDSIATLILNVGSVSTSTTNVNICPAQLPYNWNGNVYNAAGIFNFTLVGTAGCDSIATLILNVGSTSGSTTTANICPAQVPYNWNGNVYNAAGTFNVTLTGTSGCDSIATLILNVGSTSTSTTTANICPAQLPYNWNGNVYNAAGTFNVTLIGTSGCDSIATLILNVGSTSTSTTTANICPAQLPYNWNGNVYNAAGTFNVTLIGSAGCDSIATLILNVGSVSTSTTTVNICPAQLPYNWNGNVYNAAGTFNVTLIGTSGCDSIATLILNVGATSTSTTTVNICPAQLPYNWNGNVYNAAGTFNVTLIGSAGCDSIATLILNVGSVSTSTTNINICPAQLPYNWNGNVYNAAGIFNFTLVGTAGCDSIATLILNVGSTSGSTTTANICPAQVPYNWNGNVYNAAGTFNVTLTGTSGCDSIATLILNVGSTSTSTTTANICPAQLPYNWNGNVYNAAGTFNVTLIGTSGCDSIATLILNVGSTSTSTTTANICPAQLPYNWNGNVYNAAGTFNVTLIGSAGCDSIATLILNVGSVSTSTTTVNICPAQLPYNWNGNVYNAAGTFNVTLIGSAGCDSIATLILNVGSVSTSTTTANICPAQLPYNWNGNVYNAAGTFNITLVGSAGCDSVATLILNVGSTSTSTATVNICPAQLPYNWNGNVYNAAGTFNVTLVGTSGCDSIATLILNVGATSTSTTTVNICPAQLPYNWNGNVYNAAGTFNVTLTGTSGCDSIATLILNVGSTSTSTTTANICPAQLPYNWNGNVYNAAGTFNVSLTGTSGCDSIATLILNVGSTSTSTTTANICPAQLPYNWNGNVYNAAGTFNVTLTGTSGCDSIATLILNVGSTSTSTTTANICPAQLPYNWNGNVYNAAGTFNVTLVGTAGCDSIATLILNVGSVSASTTTANICPAQLPYNWNGNVYNAAGTFNVTLVGSAGCDSIATLILNVGSTSTSTTTANICPAQLPYNWNGNVYNAAGTFNVTLTGTSGCDSIATLILNVGSTSTSTTTANICPAQLPYNWNGNVYNAAGTFNITLTGTSGCDSIATLILNVGSTSTSTTTANICPAQLPYNWNGNVYNAAGTFNVTLIGSAGCDSIATLILNVGSTSTSTTTVNICPAQLPYNWNGNVYNAAGTFNVTLIGTAGCDSIATLILNVGSTSISTTTANICPAQLPYNWNGNVYNAAGTFNVTLINSSGCDSIATLILNVGSVSASTTTVNICPAQLPYNWNGNVYNAAGTFNVTLTGTSGCDSIAILVLNVYDIPSPDFGSNKTLCPGDSLILTPGIYDNYLWQDFSTLPRYIVTQPGNYSVAVSNNQGCRKSSFITIAFKTNCNEIYFPNSITPNNDGRNDGFGPLGDLAALRNYSLFIYNRYGELLFNSNNPYQRWDGTYKGQQVDIGNFVWYSEYFLPGKGKQKKKGFVIVAR